MRARCGTRPANALGRFMPLSITAVIKPLFYIISARWLLCFNPLALFYIGFSFQWFSPPLLFGVGCLLRCCFSFRPCGCSVAQLRAGVGRLRRGALFVSPRGCLRVGVSLSFVGVPLCVLLVSPPLAPAGGRRASFASLRSPSAAAPPRSRSPCRGVRKRPPRAVWRPLAGGALKHLSILTALLLIFSICLFLMHLLLCIYILFCIFVVNI